MDNQPENETKTIELQPGINTILQSIEQEREREIISRRFGLLGQRETLEQIGELLGVTRERVRQLEKAILAKLRTSVSNNKLTVVNTFEKTFIRTLTEMGRVARVQDLADKLFDGESTTKQRAQVAFISELAQNLTVISENDNYHYSVAIASLGDDKKIREQIDKIVSTIKDHGRPINIERLHDELNYEHPDFVRSLASTSKLLANLKDNWGLADWPTVNPKNIRDKIYVILADNGQPMHFSDIAEKIKSSSFRRKDVTTQAIHNELIKDSRFVLIGRGIYALDSWGFGKGTVADIIVEVLKNSPEPLHRDEIVKRVLEKRQVKETTILLNLQSKAQFKRVAKATYAFNLEMPKEQK